MNSHHSIYLKEFYIQSFLSFYSSKIGSKKLTFSNLEEVFLSKIEPELRNELIEREVINLQNQSQKNEKPNAKKKSYLSYEIESLVASLFQNEITLIQKISNICDKFFQLKNFTVYKIIEKLDTTYHNYMDEVDVEDFLVSKGLNYTRQECKSIIFRMDRDNDFKVTYQELKFLFTCHVTAEEEDSIWGSKKNKGVSNIKSNKQKMQIINTNNYKNNDAVQYDNSKSIFKRNRNNNSSPKKEKLNIITITFPKFLEEIIKIENTIEEVRITMSMCKDIILSELFFLFDILQQNYITKKNFQDTLKKFEVFPTNEEIELIFKRYELTTKGYLDFYEFSHLFLPYNREYSKIMKNRVTINNNDNLMISSSSKALLIKFFQCIIDGETQTETLRKKLTFQEEFSAYELFAKIKKQYENNGDKDEFFHYLYDYRIVLKKEEINLIYSKFDRDRDGKISYNEFIQEITPKSLIFSITQG